MRRTRRALVIGGVVAVAGVAVIIGIIAWPAPRAAAPASCGFGDATRYSITPEQAHNAALIAAVAYHKGEPDHAVTIALAASFQETGLRNLSYGDRDSVGLFQQRPSEGWGTTKQIMDPVYAASIFYDHLVKVSGWQTMAVTQAAQLVQHSATPLAYGAWEAEARALATALTGEVPAGLTCRLGSFGRAAPQLTALAQAARTELGAPLVGVPVSTKVGWQVAIWAVAHAAGERLSSVSFDDRRWTAVSGKWVAITGPGPARNAVTAA